MDTTLIDMLSLVDIDRICDIFFGSFVVINGAGLITSTFIGVKKNRAAVGVISGLLLGWYGVIVTLVVSEGSPKCHLCNHVIKEKWIVCPFCETSLKDNLNSECESCHTPLDPSWKVCPVCGEK